MPDHAVAEARMRVANASGGTNDISVYQTVLGVVEHKDLRGEAIDVGAGVGDFLRMLIDSGRFSRLTGADLMERPAGFSPSLDWIRQDLNQPVNAPDESFDVVFGLGVIEFMENPFAFTRDLFRLLRRSGTLILSTPNNESWRSAASYLVRQHFTAFVGSGACKLTALLRRDFERVLQPAGFKDIEFVYGRGSLPVFTSVSWQGISGGLLRGVRYSDDVVVVARKADPV